MMTDNIIIRSGVVSAMLTLDRFEWAFFFMRLHVNAFVEYITELTWYRNILTTRSIRRR